jgi:hypothetical protein
MKMRELGFAVQMTGEETMAIGNERVSRPCLAGLKRMTNKERQRREVWEKARRYKRKWKGH